MKGSEMNIPLYMMLGLAILGVLGAVLFLTMGKDVAFGLGGGQKDDTARMTMPPSAALKCEKTPAGGFVYDITLSESKVHLIDKADIIPALFFRIEFKLPDNLPGGVITKSYLAENTGNLPGLHYSYSFDSLVPYGNEQFSLFLFNKDDKCLQALASKSYDTSVVQNACARHLVVVESLSTTGCSGDFSYLTFKGAESPSKYGISGQDGGFCIPIFSVFNKDAADWTEKDGYKIAVKNCRGDSNGDVFYPMIGGSSIGQYINLQSGKGLLNVGGYPNYLNAYANNLYQQQAMSAYCVKSGKEREIVLYENCADSLVKPCDNLNHPDASKRPKGIVSIKFTC